MEAADKQADPWADLVEMARLHVERAEAGQVNDARAVLEQAAVALREVLAGRMPDRERIEYVRYLLGGLEKIAAGVAPARALGLEHSGGRPRSVSSVRSMVLFWYVGREYDRLTALRCVPERPILTAKKNVAKRLKIGSATVSKAWTDCGSLNGWRAAMELEETEGG